MRILLSLLLAASFSVSAAKPNIVFILVDDLGWGDVSYNGSQWVETPNIDRLAANGQIFDNAYMYPTCSPSRAALATGKHAFRTQVYNVPVLERGNAKTNLFSRWTVEKKHKFYSQVLAEHGYTLGHFGKWHLVGPNPDLEKDYPFAKKLSQPDNGDMSWLPAHQSDKYKAYYPRGRGYSVNLGGTWWGDPARGYDKGYKSASGGYHAPFKNPFITDKPSDDWLTDRMTDEAIQFMQANKNKPFFVNLHYYSVHRPSVARSPELLKKYQNKTIDPITGKDASKQKELAAYGTLVENMDDNVGRLIDYLNASGLRENTLVIFTSDNGFNGFQSKDKRFRGAKGDIYEGGIKVPLLVNWPQKIPAGRTDALVSVVDYFATFADVAGIQDSAVEETDGRSFWPLAQGKKLADRAIYWHLASAYKQPPLSVIREGNWKLIQFLNSGKVELYDLQNDQREQHNLAEKNTAQADKLLAKLVHWRKSNKVPLPPASKLAY
ncbi:sulfatase [Gayadomonas joobiniege]|uniref:sulfatase n=1 Tax=Gayadomonas joobiniege TaxID=1234606 RepID=UPI00036A088D|nr:sulfatase [Gayadomonas joobiniege]